MGCWSLLQGVFPSQGSNFGLLHCRQILYHLSHLGSPPKGGVGNTASRRVLREQDPARRRWGRGCGEHRSTEAVQGSRSHSKVGPDPAVCTEAPNTPTHGLKTKASRDVLAQEERSCNIIVKNNLKGKSLSKRPTCYRELPYPVKLERAGAFTKVFNF